MSPEVRSRLRRLLRDDRFWAAVILVGAALLRLLLFDQLADSPFGDYLGLDENYYHGRALQLAGGQGLEPPFFMSPLYQLFVGAGYALLPGTLWTIRLLQALLGLATLFVVWRTARLLVGRWWAVGALGAAALYHQLFFFETLLLPTTLTVFLVTLGIYLALRQHRRPRLWRAALVGAIFALAALAHPTAALPAATVGLFLFFKRLRRNRRRAPAELGLLVAAAVLVIAPVTIANSRAADEFVMLSTNGGLNLYLGNQPGAVGLYRPYDPQTYAADFTARRPAEAAAGRELSAVEVDDYWKERFTELWEADPGRILALSAERGLLYLNGFEYPQVENYYFEAEFVPLLRLPWLSLYLLLPLGVTGLVLARRRGARILGVAALAYFIGLLPFFVTARFRVVVAPLLVIGAALLLRRTAVTIRLLRRGAWSRSRRLRLGVFLAAGLLLVTAWAALRTPEVTRTYDNLAVGFNNLGTEAAARGDYESAIDYQRRALAESPTMVPARLNLSLALLDAGRYAAAEEELLSLRGSGLDPNRLATLIARARRRNGDDLGALAILQDAAAAPHADALVHAELSGVYLELGDAGNARRHARRAVELEPRADAGYLAAARAAVDDRAAVAHLRDGIENADNPAALNYELGRLEGDAELLWRAALAAAEAGNWELWAAALAALAR
ncbi:MAG: tetratricopeptide repeat protein [Candidatus Coatesbacteria bacterium]|nr:tetratricopeptide repeat protein [Candidatus Coatesbacteria bacterium]